MRRHGATVAGKTLEELTFRTIYTARNAAMQIQAHTLGDVSPLNAGETALAGEYNLRPGPVMRAWEYWSVRLDKAEGTSRSNGCRRKSVRNRRRNANREQSDDGFKRRARHDRGRQDRLQDPVSQSATYETETVLEGFQQTVHELLVIPETGLAYVPIFGDGIHGRNPNPGHTLWVIDLPQAQARLRHRSSPL